MACAGGVGVGLQVLSVLFATSLYYVELAETAAVGDTSAADMEATDLDSPFDTIVTAWFD